MTTHIDVSEFVLRLDELPVLDVRTSAEYDRGHVPGALSFPLFSNEERAEIGTLYKQVGRLEATRAGLEMVGPRLVSMIDDLLKIVDPGSVLVHCWRGGMRSESLAWLMSLSNQYDPLVLRDGYKAYRRFALEQFGAQREIRILSGMTGTGKTRVLHAIARQGGQVVDLEALAAHRGSAFGALGQIEPPTQQQFENDLALALFRTDPNRPVWLEDESRYIGRRTVPDLLWAQMRSARVIVLERTRDERVEHLVAEYGTFKPELLIASIRKIERRLGGARANEAAEAVLAGNLRDACHLILDYYDRTYGHGLAKRDPHSIARFDAAGTESDGVASQLLREFNA